MPKFLEDKLKAEYGEDSKTPYKVMNTIGAMHGNKETAKGRAMQEKHDQDVAAGKTKKSAKSKRAARKPGHRDDGGQYSGPAGPFGPLSHTPRAFRGNASTFAGRRADSRKRYQPVDDTENDDYSQD